MGSHTLVVLASFFMPWLGVDKYMQNKDMQNKDLQKRTL